MTQSASIAFDLVYFRQHSISYYGEAVCEDLFAGLATISFTGSVSYWAFDNFENDFYHVSLEIEGQPSLTEGDLNGLFQQYHEAFMGTSGVKNSKLTLRNSKTFRGTVVMTNGRVHKIKKEVDSWFIAAARDRINSGKHKAA